MQMLFVAMFQIIVILGLQFLQAVEALNVAAHHTIVVIVLLQ